MVRNLIQKIKAKLSPFPSEIKGHWYTGAWYMWQCDLNKFDLPAKSDKIVPFATGKKIAFDPFEVGLIYSHRNGNLVDGLIPVMMIEDMVGLYEPSKTYPRQELRSDLAAWDDGRKVDLTFKKSIPLNKVVDILQLKGRRMTFLGPDHKMVIHSKTL